MLQSTRLSFEIVIIFIATSPLCNSYYILFPLCPVIIAHITEQNYVTSVDHTQNIIKIYTIMKIDLVFRYLKEPLKYSENIIRYKLGSSPRLLSVGLCTLLLVSMQNTLGLFPSFRTTYKFLLTIVFTDESHSSAAARPSPPCRCRNAEKLSKIDFKSE